MWLTADHRQVAIVDATGYSYSICTSMALTVLPGLGEIPEWMNQRSQNRAAPFGEHLQSASRSAEASRDVILSETAENGCRTVGKKRRSLSAGLTRPQAISPRTKAEMKRMRSYGLAGPIAEKADQPKGDSAVTSGFPDEVAPLRSKQEKQET
jgi:hypothetical protein